MDKLRYRKVISSDDIPTPLPTKSPSSSLPTKYPKQSNSSTTILIITLIAFLSRLFRLSLPSQVIFDEVHFGGFASKYIKQEFFMDVHPPLGKLLIAFSGYLSGYDGNFSFEKIGLSYIGQNVPYVTMRFLPAIFGVLVIPLAYFTLLNLKASKTAALLSCILILFENALTCQSRLILLDSFLIFFTALSAYAYSEFKSLKYRPFSLYWWIFLSLTGVSISLAVSVKWVGLFTIALIGICTIRELWDLVCDNKISMNLLSRHFFARCLCLILIPFILYMAWFRIHFNLISQSGNAAGYMSPEFQATLRGDEIPDTYNDVAYGSNVYIRHDATVGGYLHSHAHFYQTGSKQQQITCYAFRDENSLFEIKKPLIESNGKLVEEAWTGFERLKHGDTIRLEHTPTKKRLHSHDHRPPVTEKKTHNEVSCYGDPADSSFVGDFNDHWRVELLNYDPAHPYINAMTSKFRIVHATTGCKLFSHDVKLPSWAFKQQEVSCATDGRHALTIWRIEHNQHPNMPSNSSKVNYRKLSFTEMFVELHKSMWKTNNNLKGSHPFSSRPASWPFLERGISFWSSEKTNSTIYLIGNPIVWWASIISIIFYFLMEVMRIVLAQRSYHLLNIDAVRSYSVSGGFLFMGWLLHYFPFFLMERELFIHHYLPSLYFSILMFGIFFDFITTRQKLIKWIIAGLIIAICVWTFLSFSPLTYGSEISASKCKSLKWRSKWDFTCKDDIKPAFISST